MLDFYMFSIKFAIFWSVLLVLKHDNQNRVIMDEMSETGICRRVFYGIG